MKYATLLVVGLCMLAAPLKPAIADNAPLAPANSVHSRTPASLPAPKRNIYELLSANPDASKFVAMVNAADQKDLFVTPPDQSITVFIPINSAIDGLSGDALSRIEANKTALSSFIAYHVIRDAVVTNSALRGRKSAPVTVSGEALTIDGTNLLNPPKINDGAVVGSDIPATNGIIHLVTSPLIPPSLQVLSKPLYQSAAAPKTPEKPVVRSPAPPPQPSLAASKPALSSTLTLSAGSLQGTTSQSPLAATMPPSNPLASEGSALNSSSTPTDAISAIARKLGW